MDVIIFVYANEFLILMVAVKMQLALTQTILTLLKVRMVVLEIDSIVQVNFPLK